MKGLVVEFGVEDIIYITVILVLTLIFSLIVISSFVAGVSLGAVLSNGKFLELLGIT